MPAFNYVALDSRGNETTGVMEVANQTEALGRLKQIGFFPTKVSAAPGQERRRPQARSAAGGKARRGALDVTINIPGLSGRVKPKVLTAFTRQLATLVAAGLPLLRGLRLLETQQKHPTLKGIIGRVGLAIEGGSTLTEALAEHPKVFNRLYVNMVKAGELGGVLEVVLGRLAEFMEKAQKIKGKVVSAMFYPCAVIFVAVVILAVLMIWVVPKFKEIFKEMIPHKPLPAFSTFVFELSATIARHLIATSLCAAAGLAALVWLVRTRFGRRLFDRFKLGMPILGNVIGQVAISRFTRTLGTLVSSGVPILQALTIVRETSGNVVVGSAIARIHDSVKEGETITAPLAASGVFPPLVIGMVDVGEQTGALPEMLMKIADTYDEEVDNAVSAMTSLLEPVMIVLLAVIVGGIVIALFLPLITIIDGAGDLDGNGRNAELNSE